MVERPQAVVPGEPKVMAVDSRKKKNRSTNSVGLAWRLAVKQGPAHFNPVAERCLAGDLRIHVDRTFGLEEVSGRSRTSGKAEPSGKSSSRCPESRQARIARQPRQRLQTTSGGSPRLGVCVPEGIRQTCEGFVGGRPGEQGTSKALLRGCFSPKTRYPTELQ